ncbi:hydrolase [Virgibacillus sp. W0181]|uniref:hydrolase n=1 Tax=Virgibacillus sp. W0181 TaxID=3391581 RepID=UPI003F449814
MKKEKFYVSIASGEISRSRYHNNDDFTIYATEEEVRQLRTRIDNMYHADFNSFWRSHVPFKPYHNDKANETYDDEITNTFQMLYKLGDEQAKEYINSTGILSDHHM